MAKDAIVSDEFAKRSYALASAAQKSGAFAKEIAQVSIAQKKSDPLLVTEDGNGTVWRIRYGS